MECADPRVDDPVEVSDENCIEKLPIYATEKLKSLHPARNSSSSIAVERDPPSTDLTNNNVIVNTSGPRDIFNENRIDELPATHRKRVIVSSTKKRSPSSAVVNMAYDDQIVEDSNSNAATVDDPTDVFDSIRFEEQPTKEMKTTTNRKPKISSSTDRYVDCDKRKVNESSTNIPSLDGPTDISVKTTNRKREIFSSKIDQPSTNLNYYVSTDIGANALTNDDPMEAFSESPIEKAPIYTSARLKTTNRKQKIASSIDARRDSPLAHIDCPDQNVSSVGNPPAKSNYIIGNKICNIVTCDANMKDIISNINQSLKDPVEICEEHIRSLNDFINR